MTCVCVARVAKRIERSHDGTALASPLLGVALPLQRRCMWAWGRPLQVLELSRKPARLKAGQQFLNTPSVSLLVVCLSVLLAS